MTRAPIMAVVGLSLAACAGDGNEAHDGEATNDAAVAHERDGGSRMSSDGASLDGASLDGASRDATSPPSSCLGTWTGERCVLMLASGQSFPAALAVDSTDVYWTNTGTNAERYSDGTVMKTSKNGGVLITLATSQPFPLSIALDETSVYWPVYAPTNVAALVKMPKGGGTPTTIVSGWPDVSGVVVSAGSAYFVDNGVLKTSVDGGAPVTLAATQYDINGLVANASGVYWTNHGSVLGVGLQGGATTTLAVASDGGTASSIAVDDTHVYWLKTEGDAGAIVRAPLRGGAIVTIATASTGTFGLAVGATGLYWQVDDGDDFTNPLMKVGLDGGVATTLVSGLGEPSSLDWAYGFGTTAVDETSVYVISGNAILKVTPN